MILVASLARSDLMIIFEICIQVNQKILGRLHQVQRITRRLKKERRYFKKNPHLMRVVQCFRPAASSGTLLMLQVPHEDPGCSRGRLQKRPAHHPAGGEALHDVLFTTRQVYKSC